MDGLVLTSNVSLGQIIQVVTMIGSVGIFLVRQSEKADVHGKTLKEHGEVLDKLTENIAMLSIASRGTEVRIDGADKRLSRLEERDDRDDRPNRRPRT